MLGNLRRFEFSINTMSLESEAELRAIGTCLGVSPLLAELTVRWTRDQPPRIIPWRRNITEGLCQIIPGLDKLQKIRFLGEWAFTENTIIALLRSLSRSLQYLVLEDPILVVPFSDEGCAGWQFFLSIVITSLISPMKLVHISNPHNTAYDPINPTDPTPIIDPRRPVFCTTDLEKEAKNLPTDCMVHIESQDFSLTLVNG